MLRTAIDRRSQMMHRAIEERLCLSLGTQDEFMLSGFITTSMRMVQPALKAVLFTHVYSHQP